MKFISTRHEKLTVTFEEALFQGLAPDKGLYVPAKFPHIDASVFEHLPHYSLPELGEVIMRHFITDIPHKRLHDILHHALSFPIPLVHLEKNIYLLEVFHGPTLAFKDVGARFMANVLAYFSEAKQRKIKIIVATSGDTGSAIAHAFYQAPHIEVYILYPSKKISALQEMQMTTFGGNIHAIEVAGTFDDCQRLVKEALSDDTLKTDQTLTTSNSINISRLLPQIIYHAWGLAQLQQHGVHTAPDLVVPSGNLGNLTSAVYAKRLGFKIHEFVSAMNANHVFGDYLHTGEFHAHPSLKTYANAMDVGNPSNFERLQQLYEHHPHQMEREIKGISISDTEILAEIKSTYTSTGTILDPHTAVGVAAAKRHHQDHQPVIVTATAHPAKFPDVIKKAIDRDVPLPESLAKLLHQPKLSTPINVDYRALHHLLIKQSE